MVVVHEAQPGPGKIKQPHDSADDDIYIMMSVCLFVCNEKSSLFLENLFLKFFFLKIVFFFIFFLKIFLKFFFENFFLKIFF